MSQVQYDDITIPSGSLRYKFWAYVWRVTGQRSLLKFLFQGLIFTTFSCFPTIVGSVIRGKLYRAVLGRIGSNCLIEKNVRFYVPGMIFLGKRVLIGENSYLLSAPRKGKIEIQDDVYVSQCVTLRAGPGNLFIDERVNIGAGTIIYGYGGISIGKNTLISNHCNLLSGDHVYKDPSIPIRFQGGKGKKIVIEGDVWLGACVIVLGGVTIGQGSVVGAGAVVTKDIPRFSIAAGVPAKVIKKRE